MDQPLACSATGEGMPVYNVDGADAGPGPSFGNGHCWVNLDSGGGVRTLFCTDIGEEVAGPFGVRYASADAFVVECSGGVCRTRANVPLSATDPGSFSIYPSRQVHSFWLPGPVSVKETVLLPHVSHGHPADTCAVHLSTILRNDSARNRTISVYGFARLGGTRRTPLIEGDCDPEQNCLFAWEQGHPDWVRVLSSSHAVKSWAITDDLAFIYDADWMVTLDNQVEGTGDVLGCLEVELELPPTGSEEVVFTLFFSPEGRTAAERDLEKVSDSETASRATAKYFREQLSVCRVFTPDPVINSGSTWSKVNMLRVLAHYPRGLSFTNEPGVSSNVVARDAIWFAYGCDHFRPDVSRKLLDALARCQYPDGKIPEYYDARTGEVADYDLNINDGTPLFVLGVNHHVRSTGDMRYLAGMYDSVASACRYILSQRDERGLVYCDAEGVEVWGICSWRNVIPNYQINGAVTEINSECAAALRAMGHMAENLGKQGDADFFLGEADKVKRAINTHLLDRERQLYLLNIDTEGRRRTDVTADEIFPVLFRVAPQDVAFHIVRRLNNPDFWTSAGLRTASRLDPRYDPSRHVGLIGGVWPGLTWWYAFAAARYHPQFLVRGLHAAFEHYNLNPRVYNTVPGQFSEWFDGESLVNRGMRLSPWEPPRFLWAAVEGVAGLMVSPDKPGVNVLRPPDWKWVAAAEVCYHGSRLSFFAARQGDKLQVYTNTEFEYDGRQEVFAQDISGRISAQHAGVHGVALKREGRVLVALGSSLEEAVNLPLALDGVVDAGKRVNLRQFSSERGSWSPAQLLPGERWRQLGVRLEARGYHLLEFSTGERTR